MVERADGAGGSTVTMTLLLAVIAVLHGGCEAGTEPDAGPPEDGSAGDSGRDVLADGSGDAGREAGGLGYEELEQIDQDVLRTAATAYGIFEETAATVWSEGYRFDRLPLTLLRRDSGRGDHAYLLNHPGVDGASPVALPTALTILGTTLRVDELPRYPAEDWPFEIHWDVDGTDTLLVTFRLSSDPMEDVTDPGWLVYMVHEGFHHFQDVERWGLVDGATQDSTGYPLEPTNASLAMVEGRALIAALGATSAAEQLTAVEDFLVVRADRLERWPIVRRLDESQEKFEGTARYMEVGLDDALGSDGLSRLLEELQRDVDPTYLAHAAGDVLSFDRFYATGAAIGVMLDELGPAWKGQMVEDDLAPADLLRDAVPVELSAERLDDALTRHDHATALAQAETFDYTVHLWD